MALALKLIFDWPLTGIKLRLFRFRSTHCRLLWVVLNSENGNSQEAACQPPVYLPSRPSTTHQCHGSTDRLGQQHNLAQAQSRRRQTMTRAAVHRQAQDVVYPELGRRQPHQYLLFRHKYQLLVCRSGAPRRVACRIAHPERVAAPVGLGRWSKHAHQRKWLVVIAPLQFRPLPSTAY
jgi:hypothetical protein